MQTTNKPVCIVQSLSEQEVHLKAQVKELEANVIATAPDKTKQKELEKKCNSYKEGKLTSPMKWDEIIKNMHTPVMLV